MGGALAERANHPSRPASAKSGAGDASAAGQLQGAPTQQTCAADDGDGETCTGALDVEDGRGHVSMATPHEIRSPQRCVHMHLVFVNSKRKGDAQVDDVHSPCDVLDSDGDDNHIM